MQNAFLAIKLAIDDRDQIVFMCCCCCILLLFSGFPSCQIVEVFFCGLVMKPHCVLFFFSSTPLYIWIQFVVSKIHVIYSQFLQISVNDKLSIKNVFKLYLFVTISSGAWFNNVGSNNVRSLKIFYIEKKVNNRICPIRQKKIG